MRTDWRVEERLREKLALLSQELSETLAALDAVRADLAASEKAREEAERELGVLGEHYALEIKARHAAESRAARLAEKVSRIESACGLPDPAEACRVVLAIAAEEGGGVAVGEIISSADVQTISTQNAALRAEVERLKKALRHSARELQYIADDDPCDKCHQSGEGRACVALAERILGPMHTWPDEPNLSAPAEEDGRDA